VTSQGAKRTLSGKRLSSISPFSAWRSAAITHAPFGHEQLDRAQADARAASGDHGDLAVQTSSHASSLRDAASLKDR
jgi:hypothetical protein